MVTTGFYKRLKYFPRIFQGQFEKKNKTQGKYKWDQTNAAFCDINGMLELVKLNLAIVKKVEIQQSILLDQ